MSIKLTSAYWKIKEMQSRIKCIQGGMGAGKNMSIAIIWFEKMMAGSNEFCTIMTDTYDNLKDGAIKDFRFVFEKAGLDFDDYYNKNDRELTFKNSIVQFRHISDSRKTTGKSKRRDKLYINEANKVSWDTASSFIGRTHGEVYLDYNPDFEFWGHTEIPKLKEENGKQSSQQIILTYLDNEEIPKSEKEFIESRKNNSDWWRVYGLGLTGFYSERMIYKYKFYDELPSDARRIASGMDFGTSPDPTVLVDIWLKDNNLYCHEVFSENGLMDEKIPGAERMAIVDKMDEINFRKGWEIIGDSANRTAINDLNKYNYNCVGVKKKLKSVIDGIKKLRGYDIHISRSSTNIKKGIESWFFKVDLNGKIKPEPIGHEPDTLAAIRYVVMMLDEGVQIY